MGEEYTYNIGKYTIGVDTNGEDGIGLTVAIIENDKINFLGSCYGDNARCIDLLIRENQILTKKYNKALQLLTDYNLPCEIDEFNTKEENIDYCSRNCRVDEAIFIKCWDRYIEQILKEEVE